jgi:hypothetical protein
VHPHLRHTSRLTRAAGCSRNNPWYHVREGHQYLR